MMRRSVILEGRQCSSPGRSSSFHRIIVCLAMVGFVFTLNGCGSSSIEGYNPATGDFLGNVNYFLTGSAIQLSGALDTMASTVTGLLGLSTAAPADATVTQASTPLSTAVVPAAPAGVQQNVLDKEVRSTQIPEITQQ
jgi:hypothetical protein